MKVKKDKKRTILQIENKDCSLIKITFYKKSVSITYKK